MPCPATGAVPRELPAGEIGHIVELFAHASRRARLAGADAIELQMGHGYLIGQFLSGLVNRRSDDYGGALEQRMRLALEVLD